jgi:hypothetical protein
MTQRTRRRWFSVVSVIGGLWGVVFTIFGLGVLPVNREVLLSWESALYGSILIGWGHDIVSRRTNCPRTV